jgi:prepilin-type N-terminal cleavage/methylation domain-containing protein
MIARVRGRLAESGGYTLSEMIVVLAILLIVVAALAQLFESATKAEVDMSNRFQAQQNARLALDGLRREIHCASDVTWTGTPPVSSITITLGKYCASNTTGATASFTWCTTGTGVPYTLWRYIGTSCAGTGKPWVSNLTTPNVFTAYTAPASGSLGTLSVDLPVDLTPSDAKQRYDVQDNIVLRNTIRL